MKFHCEKGLLEQAIQTVGRAVSSRASLPVLSHILLQTRGDQVRFTGSDLETTIQCDVAARVEQEGSCTLPARLLAEVVGELPDGPVLIVDVGAQTHFECRETRFKVNSTASDEYPSVPAPAATQWSEMPQHLLRQALKAVSVASASQEETRAVLQGVHMTLQGTLATFVATDGRRLAKMELSLPAAIEPPQVAILPGRVAAELQRLLKDVPDAVHFTLQGGSIFFRVDGTLIGARLLDGKYPNYRNLLPSQFATTVRVDRDLLSAAIRRSLVMAQEKAVPRLVRLRFSGDLAEITSNSPDLGAMRDTVPVVCQGPDLEIAFNGRFLLDGLQTFTEPDIKLLMNEPASAALLQPMASTVEYLYLIMPVRLQKDEPVPVGAASAAG